MTSNGTSKGWIGLRWRVVLALFVGLFFGSRLTWAAGKAFPPMREEDSPWNYIVPSRVDWGTG